VTAPTEPLKVTLDELFAFLGEREYSLTFAGGVYFALPPEHSPAMHGEGATPWEAASAAFPRCKFVARHDAAELRAAGHQSVRLIEWLSSREGTALEDAAEAEALVNRLRTALAASEGQP